MNHRYDRDCPCCDENAFRLYRTARDRLLVLMQARAGLAEVLFGWLG